MEYDALGNIVRHENDWASVKLRRNSQGLILDEITTVKATNGLSGVSWHVEQSFNQSGNRIMLTLPSGRTIAYSYDTTGRVTSVSNVSTPASYPGSILTSDSSVLARFEYAGQKWRRTIFQSASAAIIAKRDARSQVCERLVINETTGDIIWRAQIFLDSARQAGLETAFVKGGSRSRYFSMDVFGRLTGYTDKSAAWIDPSIIAPPGRPKIPAAANTTQKTIEALIKVTPPSTNFSYDLIGGNRVLSIQSGSPPTALAADDDNRYLTVGGKVWNYDLEGRLLSDDSHFFQYSSDGFLAEEFENVGGATTRTSAMIRDAVGRVVAIISVRGADYVAYANSAPVAQFGSGGLKEFTPGRFVDEPLHIAAEGHDIWIVADAVRSPRVLLRRGPSKSNDVITFRPFGQPETADSAAEIFGFAGMLRFPGSSLMHTPHRSYRTDVGRYLQQDPAGIVDGMNRYAYAGNNPIDLFDPLGLQAFSASDDRIFAALERIAAELKLDETHAALANSPAGSNKHLELQFTVANMHTSRYTAGLSVEEELRIAPEIWVDEKGIIQAVDRPPNGAPKNWHTIDLAIVKADIPNGREAILNKKSPKRCFVYYAIGTNSLRIQQTCEIEKKLKH